MRHEHGLRQLAALPRKRGETGRWQSTKDKQVVVAGDAQCAELCKSHHTLVGLRAGPPSYQQLIDSTVLDDVKHGLEGGQFGMASDGRPNRIELTPEIVEFIRSAATGSGVQVADR